MSGRGPATRVLLLCGGQSDEHDVSLASARSVLEAAHGAFEVVPLVIARSGNLLPLADSAALLGLPAPTAADGPAHHARPVGSGDAGGPGVSGGLERLVEHGAAASFDVVFPLLHGPFGEDGSVQGLLKVLGLPFVGSGVLGSAVGMDKLMMKAVFAAHDLPQVAYRAVTRHRWDHRRDEVLADLEQLPAPRFVKPANLGSSIGIRRTVDLAELVEAVGAALAFDRRVIVERGVVGARELEVGVLGNDDPDVSPVGEIGHRSDFYDYATKYTDGRADLLIPAPVPEAVAQRCRDLAARAFAAVDAAGLARVDFFYREDDDDVILNEINTMPGFTRHSMYPKLWAAAGLPYDRLVARLLELAREER